MSDTITAGDVLAVLGALVMISSVVAPAAALPASSNGAAPHDAVLGTSDVESTTAGETAGEVSNFRVVQRGFATSGETVTTSERTDDTSVVTRETEDSVVTQSHREGRQIRVTLENPRRAIGSSDVVRVRVGAYNGTTLVPLTNYSLTVNLTNRTSGVMASQTVTTNASGGAVVTFDMAPYADGRYTIEATDGTESESAEFVAGEFTTLFPRFGDQSTNTGREVTYGVRVTNGGTPVSGVTRNVTIRDERGMPVARKTVTTNADGVGTFSFTPSEFGRFRVSVERSAVGSTFGSFTVAAATAQVGLPEEGYESFRPGQTVPITGFARVNGTPLSSTGLELRVRNDSSAVVDTISVTTDARGAFSADWTIPGGTTERDYTIDVRTGGGQPVAAGSPTIDVERPDGGPGPGPEPSLDVRITTSGFEYVPGTKLNVSATVTDSDGNPVSGATVNLLNTLGFRGALVPVGNATVTTDSAGVARATFVLPDNLDYGVEDGQFRATTVVNGTRLTDSDYYRLEHVEIDPRFSGLDEDFSFVPGSTATFNYTVREATNDGTLGDPVSGVPIHAAGIYEDYEAGIFGTAYAATNATGQASLSVPIPGDAAGRLDIDVSSTVPDIFGIGSGVDGYNTQLNGIDRGEYARNDTIEFNYTVNTTSTVRAFVTVTTFSDVNDSVLFSEYVKPGDTKSFTIPKTVPNETFYDIRVRAMSNAGVSGAADAGIEVRGGPTANETAEANVTAERTIHGSGAPGENVSVTVRARTSAAVSGATIDEDLPGNLSIVSQSTTPAATYDASEERWSWSTASADATLTVNYTVAIPENASTGETFRITGEVSSDGQAPLAIEGDETIAVGGCIEGEVAGTDGRISLSEIQTAIDWWARGTVVPDTGGETISLSEIQSLIDAWADDDPVSCR